MIYNIENQPKQAFAYYMQCKEFANVYGNATIYGYSYISGHAKVYDNAEIYCDAKISGNTEVNQGTKLGKDAYISSNNDYINIGPIYDSNSYMTFYMSEDKSIMIKYNHFNGSIDKFINYINDVYRTDIENWNKFMNIVNSARNILINN